MVILQLHVLNGDGQTHRAGARTAQLLTVQVTDEMGRPVPKATVSVRLPDEGVTGHFTRGLNTDVVLTGSDGRASFGPVQWTKAEGPVMLRITAAKGLVRAGAVCQQFVASGGPAPAVASAESKPAMNDTAATGDPTAAKTNADSAPRRPGGHHLSTKTVWMIVGTTVSVVTTLAFAKKVQSIAPVITTPQPTSLPTAGPAPTIGSPTITVGHP